MEILNGQRDRRWWSRLDELRTLLQQYKEMPARDSVLGTWVHNQRRRKSRLGIERIRALESIPGWCWSVRQTYTDRAFVALLKFSQEKGTCAVPQGYECSDGLRLGAWVANARRYHTRGVLNPSIESRLARLPGWVWTVGRGPIQSLPEASLRENLSRAIGTDAVRTVWLAGCRLRPDMAWPDLMLCVEYDGRRWHTGSAFVAKDLSKNDLLVRNGWTVVRVREAPLPQLASHDLLVDPAMDLKDLAELVTSHLRNLGYPVGQGDISPLESCGPVYGSINDKQWFAMLARCDRLLAGWLHDPYTPPIDAECNRWMSRQRALLAKARLHPDRAGAFRVVLSRYPESRVDAIWERSLRRYYEALQGESVMTRYLKNWIRSQRKIFRGASMRPDRAATLERTLGERWCARTGRGRMPGSTLESLTTAWKTSLDDEIAHQRAMRLPCDTQWGREQKRRFHQGQLEAWKERALSRISGWTWEPLPTARQTERWLRQFDRWADPISRRANGRPVSIWASEQRKLRAAGRLHPARVVLLEAAAEWDWSPLRRFGSQPSDVQTHASSRPQEV